jgi:hypothetical protein
MTSTTPPPAPVENVPAGPGPGSADDAPAGRRFGSARAFGLALAAFLGGYLALQALTEAVEIVRDDLFSQYDPFGAQGAVGRFRLLSLFAEGLGALAGVVAVIGLAARRWALGVLVLTLVSVLCHLGYAAQIADTSYRSLFLEPGRNWSPSNGLAYSATVVALQLLVIVLCLVRGPRPHPVVVLAPPSGAPAAAWAPESPGSEPSEESAERGGPVEEDPADDPTDDPVEDDPAEPADVFLVIHGQEYGPYPPERVRGFMVEGRIHPGTLVRIGDETLPASEVPAIFGS